MTDINYDVAEPGRTGMSKVFSLGWDVFDKNIAAATVKVLRGFKVQLTKSALEKLLQFFKFGMAGVFNMIAYYVVYALWIIFGGHYVMANMFGFVANVFSAFYWNYKYVFKAEEGEKRNKWRSLLRTFVTYGFSGLVVNNVMLFVWIDVLNLTEFLGPVLNLFITIPMNFLINKKWACRGVKAE